MSEILNLYYSPDRLGLQMLNIEDPEADYSFCMLVFWVTPDGRVFSADDEGGSEPIPFEHLEGTELEEILQKMERVGSVEQALRIFDAWNKKYGDRPIVGPLERERLSEWMKAVQPKKEG